MICFYEGTFNPYACSTIFGEDLNRIQFNDIVFDTDAANEWVWRPLSSKAMTVATIYDYLNSEHLDMHTWNGWNFIWKLKVVPRVKVFIWKLAHGKLPTRSYLYNLNLGPDSLCSFCGIHSDNAEHLIWNFRNSVSCWNNVLNWLGLDHSFHVILA